MRKAPQQQRSKIIVDHILEATQQCIAQYGLLHTTTPKIAEKSGVSVGSIYQYFENKDQIIEELLRRKSELLGQQLKELVVRQGNIPLELLIPLAIELGFNALKADHGFFIEVLKHWHDYSHSQAAQILEKHFFEVGLYTFSRNPHQWDFEQVKHKSFVIINSTLFTMMRYVSQNNFPLYTTNFTEPLSYQDSAFLKLPKFP
ncbi:TetR/AcrR family transcriptional regulator [Acinetobacter baumannii]|uniref:TetR/AcrR family transcriptional regulator n=10 Tax=Acinetobacter TaxID=469 RepID=UPI0008FDA6FA|nr:TetR/AcrR family transcriptional regulator [Acinetobacter baumannii]